MTDKIEREALADAIAAAFCAGAEAVHNAWIMGTNSVEADFGEAASDYAASVNLDPRLEAAKTLALNTIQKLEHYQRSLELITKHLKVDPSLKAFTVQQAKFDEANKHLREMVPEIIATIRALLMDPPTGDGEDA